MALKLGAELHSEQMENVEQKPPVLDPSTYDGDVVIGERIANAEYLEDLAMMEEPVTIRIEPSSDKNAAGAQYYCVNGKPAEILINDRWRELGWLPVGQVLTIKRKVLEVILRAKTDSVHNKVLEPDSDRPNNVIDRYTTPATSFSILEDSNPKGAAWATAIRRRNY
jgi:hypothetical protein